MMTENELNAIRERMDEATPGPWDFHVLPQSVGITAATIHSEHGPRETCWTVDLPPEIGGMGTKEDAEFIAHAPEDIAALVAEVEQLRATIHVLTSERDSALERNNDLIKQSEKQQSRLSAVENLHRRSTHKSDEPYCETCYQAPYGYAPYPCPTIRALEGEK